MFTRVVLFSSNRRTFFSNFFLRRYLPVLSVGWVRTLVLFARWSSALPTTLPLLPSRRCFFFLLLPFRYLARLLLMFIDSSVALMFAYQIRRTK